MGRTAPRLRTFLDGKRRWILPLLVLAAFSLRVYRLGALEFVFDEAISANIAELGWQGVLAHLRSEPFEHPPVYYLSLTPWLSTLRSTTCP
jgi:hypothetical protein